MTVYDMCDRICKAQSCIDALATLRCHRDANGLDREALEEEMDEIIRSMHDTAREFESECIKRGKERAAREISAVVTANGTERRDLDEQFMLKIVS